MTAPTNETSTNKQRVKHDWTFFFFLTIAFILVAAAIAWVSAKAGLFVSAEQVENEAPYSYKSP